MPSSQLSNRLKSQTTLGMAAEKKVVLTEVLPQKGIVFREESPELVMCKPKILPLKSVTLEKLEKMQQEARNIQNVPEIEVTAPPGEDVETSGDDSA